MVGDSRLGEFKLAFDITDTDFAGVAAENVQHLYPNRAADGFEELGQIFRRLHSHAQHWTWGATTGAFAALAGLDCLGQYTAGCHDLLLFFVTGTSISPKSKFINIVSRQKKGWTQINTDPEKICVHLRPGNFYLQPFLACGQIAL
jgi:hypothetical protein